MLLAWLVNKFQGRLTLFDVFGRIPAPSGQDGDKAARRYEEINNLEGEDYYGNIDNVLGLVLKDLQSVCPLERIETVKGKYEEILPSLCDQRQFHLVHIDCDWYESSLAVYNYLRSRLAPSAIIQVDDYSQWEGSKRAFIEIEWLANYPSKIIDGALVVDTSKTR
jgi:hypothetical protein